MPNSKTATLHLPDGRDLIALSKKKDILCILVRHSGCTFCREALDSLQKHIHDLNQRNLKIFVIHMGPEESSETLKNIYQLPKAEVIADPEMGLYRSLGAERATLKKVIGPKVIWDGLRSGALARHGIGKPQGDVFQLGGVFLIQKEVVSVVHKPESAADAMNWPQFLKNRKAP